MPLNQFPQRPPAIDTKVHMRFPPGGKEVLATIIDEVSLRFVGIRGFRGVEACAQLLDFGSERRIRVGYYIIGKKPAMRGRWVWGQYALVIPPADLNRLVKLMKERGWFNPKAA